jgi:hypothetical protein
VILVISHAGDPHARAVLDLLAAHGADVGLIDLSDLPARATLAIDFADPLRPALALQLPSGEVDLQATTATWWRRPQAPDPSAIGDPNVRWFASSEWSEALAGLWLLLGGRWMNVPALDERASHKPFQLRVAAEVGLTVPRTLMTSDPDRARAFIEELGVGRVVFKTFAATATVWRETRLVRPQEVDILDAVRQAPVIFQEYVEATSDVRVTVVGEEIFALAIDARTSGYPLDFRMSLGESRTEAVVLPADVRARIRALMERLGLAYGAIDLRRAPDGDYVFLEINPAGEFLFAQDRSGQPIGDAVARWLIDGGSTSTAPAS